ncbi:MAG: hypothetical protein PGN26_07780 [Xylophilus ampelinus]
MSAPAAGRPLSSGWPEEYRACQREAVAGAPALMRELLDHARAALPSRGVLRRSAPLRELDRFATLLADGFQAQLARALQVPPPVPPSFAWPALADADKAELRRYRAEVDAANLQFAEFDLLWVAAVPLDALGRQPLHPATYLAALQSAVEMADVLPELRQLWLRHLRSALPGRLAGVYLRLASGLEAAGVPPSSIEERNAAQMAALDSLIVHPVDLATFSERFAQRFEDTLPVEPAPQARPAAAPARSDRGPSARPVPAQRPAAPAPGPAAMPGAGAPATAAATAPVEPRGPVAGAGPAPESGAARGPLPPLPPEGARLDIAEAGPDGGLPSAATEWTAWQVAWHGAGGRLLLLRGADGRERSMTRAAFLRLQREGGLRIR